MRLLMSWLLFLTIAASASAADISGKWTGNVEVTTPEGNLANEPAWADFKVNGKEVTGTAGGGDSDESLTIEKGTFDGKNLGFQVTGQDGRVYKVKLALVDDDRLEGTLDFSLPDGTPMKGKMTLKRGSAR